MDWLVQPAPREFDDPAEDAFIAPDASTNHHMGASNRPQELTEILLALA